MNYFEDRTHQIEPEKLKAFGIEIMSRYGKAEEICEMIAFCKILATKGITSVAKVFYDTKACVCSVP